MSLNVSIEDAYAEACRALGEAIVTQRLLAAEVARLHAQQGAAATEPRPPA